VASPNQEGVERTDWEEVWMITDPSAILFLGASLMEVVLFFLLKEAHFGLYSLEVTSRCASRGLEKHVEETLTEAAPWLRIFPSRSQARKIAQGERLMEVLYPRCCGLDVHKSFIMACLIVVGTDGHRHKEIRRFGTMTGELLELVDWLQAANCTHVAMESTGVYTPPLMLPKMC
jgi:hypothetical protein